jgi:hypothetical protein
MLRDRDSEIRGLEESVAEHEADEAKVSSDIHHVLPAHEQYTREMQALEAEVKRLEGELATARQAESVLETQKQENLQLKETIDRMRFDLEEAKNNAVNAGKGHGRTATTNSSVEGTLSRNLGDEINRKLLDAQAVAEDDAGDEDTGEGEGDVETVVTIQRTRVRMLVRVIQTVSLISRSLAAARCPIRTAKLRAAPPCRLYRSRRRSGNTPMQARPPSRFVFCRLRRMMRCQRGTKLVLPLQCPRLLRKITRRRTPPSPRRSASRKC